MIKLYNYHRSSASFRVRIALNFKNIDYQLCNVDLSQGEQFYTDFLAINPQKLVPILIDGNTKITQSLAILEYLEETYPEIPLLPASYKSKAKIRSLMQLIACEIQPTGNLTTLDYLKNNSSFDEQKLNSWSQYWIHKGFEAIETILANDPETGVFCCKDKPTLADICLFPQVFNAKRLNCDLTDFQEIRRIVQNCEKIDAFVKASPLTN